ncbi:MAG TPA: alpha/beta hydrolase-fold protein [Bryobacteraceae bacterium]|jgi:S-formylglutathione hydrolase
MAARVSLGEISSPHLPAAVPYAVLEPIADRPLPLCILLLGAGGTRDHLADLQPVFDGWWAEGAVPPMIVATPTPANDYYMEDPGGRIRWDSFLAGDFVRHLRATCNAGGATLLAGISGGGYGALKLAFDRPHDFAAVAAMQPMLEPALRECDVRPRNRLHHAAGGPPELIGEQRNPALWESNNPANRARANAEKIREAGIAIYLEAADRDFLNAHDGAEFLHRLLWDLDLPHEYRLIHGADHGGPTMRPRMRSMFAWFGGVVNPAPRDPAAEEAAARWIESGMQGKPPAGATATERFIQTLRARFEPLRDKAAERDPTVKRRLGPV